MVALCVERPYGQTVEFIQRDCIEPSTSVWKLTCAFCAEAKWLSGDTCGQRCSTTSTARTAVRQQCAARRRVWRTEDAAEVEKHVIENWVRPLLLKALSVIFDKHTGTCLALLVGHVCHGNVALTLPALKSDQGQTATVCVVSANANSTGVKTNTRYYAVTA